MDQPNHQQYYLTRAQASRELARRATSPSIAAIHVELAARYEAMVAQLGGRDGGAQAA